MWDKWDEVWDAIKNKLGIKFHSEPLYEYRYLKAKAREFDDVIKTNILGNDVPKENIRQVYLEECKYRTKKYKCLDL